MAWQRIALALVAVGSAVAAPAAHAHDLSGARPSLASLPALPAPSASSSDDAPDLRIGLPTVPYSGQVAPVYVDAYEQPGRLLYRFDAVIENTGGTLDLFGGATEVRQKIWPGGEPTTAPVADAPPPGPSEDRTPTGARFAYVVEPTHEHWHFFSAARYSLLVPGGADRVSEKIGFCLFDSFDIEGGATKWFPWDAESANWCRFSEPASTFVRMGLSRGSGDRYSAQREFQFVDITGLAPGTYTLHAQANPDGHLIEADPSDDVHEEQRVVPGVIASPASLFVQTGLPGAVDVSARAVAPEIPARRSGDCTPRSVSESCYARITAGTPLTYEVVSGPSHGTASGGAGLTYEWKRAGYAFTGSSLWARRAEWHPWGAPGPPEKTSPDYAKYSLGLSKDVYVGPFQKIHLNAAYFGGRRLDRFTQYQFGLFDDTRMHGVPSAGVRFGELVMARGSYAFLSLIHI